MDSQKLGNYEVGYKKPPKNRRFGQPDGNKRSNGAWKKEDTPRYKLEKMMQLTESELLEIAKDKNAPYFERKLAVCINKGDWKVIEGMVNQCYGTPKQQVETIDRTPKSIEVKVLKPVESKGAKKTNKNSSKS